ncbi:MAG: transposase family protein, partial [Chromatiaceae bacterium]
MSDFRGPLLSGADGWEAIEAFGREKLGWPRQFAPFKNGVPSPDGIANVLSRWSPKGFQECLGSGTRAVATATAGAVIAVGGKT